MNLEKITKTIGRYEVRELDYNEEGCISGEVFDNIWLTESWFLNGLYLNNEPDPYDLDLSDIETTDPTATTEQTKPDHYPNSGKNDVIAFCQSNNIGFIEGNIIKYVTRHKAKNGLNDLHKAQEYLNRLIQNYGQRD